LAHHNTSNQNSVRGRQCTK